MGRVNPDSAEAGAFRLADSPSHLLHRAEQMAADRFAQLVGGAITLRQFAVLAAVAAQPGVRQSALSRATGVDRSTLAEILTRMQRRGWLTRARSAVDARAQEIRLTAAGELLLTQIAKHARAADAAILDALPRTKRRTLLNLLTRLAEIAEKLADKAEREQRRQAKRDAKERAQARARAQAKAKAKARVKPRPRRPRR